MKTDSAILVAALSRSDVIPGVRTEGIDDASLPPPIRRVKWTDQQKAEMAERVRQDFLHAWNGYKQYAWGHDELQPADQELSRLVRPHEGDQRAGRWGARDSTSLLMTPVDALDTMVLMGLKDEADKDRELIDKQALVRQGHLRQEFRDHDSPAGRPAQQLSAHRRQAPAGAGRRSGHAPAAGVQLADRHAVCLRQPEDRRDEGRGEQSGRDRLAAHRVRHAQQADRQAGLLRQGQARAARGLRSPLADRAGRLHASTSKPASGSIPSATSAAASIRITSTC